MKMKITINKFRFEIGVNVKEIITLILFVKILLG